jgi:hypothetical protein
MCVRSSGWLLLLGFSPSPKSIPIFAASLFLKELHNGVRLRPRFHEAKHQCIRPT